MFVDYGEPTYEGYNLQEMGPAELWWADEQPDYSPNNGKSFSSARVIQAGTFTSGLNYLSMYIKFTDNQSNLGIV